MGTTVKASIGCKVFIFNQKGELLLLKKGSRSGRIKWDIPGGGLVQGEQPWQAAIREVIEETGLELEGVELIEAVTDMAKRGFSVYLLYQSKTRLDEVVISDEHQGYAWINTNELDEYDLKDRYRSALKSIT